jgi:hypothetical protein
LFRLTPDITRPPSGTTKNHVSYAAAAPVHVVVRHPSKARHAFRFRMMRPDGIAAPAFGLSPSDCAAGEQVKDDAGEWREDDAAK